MIRLNYLHGREGNKTQVNVDYFQNGITNALDNQDTELAK